MFIWVLRISSLWKTREWYQFHNPEDLYVVIRWEKIPYAKEIPSGWPWKAISFINQFDNFSDEKIEERPLVSEIQKWSILPALARLGIRWNSTECSRILWSSAEYRDSLQTRRWEGSLYFWAGDRHPPTHPRFFCTATCPWVNHMTPWTFLL